MSSRDGLDPATNRPRVEGPVVLRALRGQIFYGWYIAGAGAGSNFIVIGFTIFGIGVFIEPMRDELHWSLTAIAVGISLRAFENGLLAPVSGILVDRLGPRRMALIGLVLVSAGLMMFSQVHALWMFYAASGTIALGQSIGSFTPFSVAVVRWFQRNRGRAMGLLNSGNGAGYLLVPVLALLITNVGWRETLMIMSVVTLVVGIPLSMVLRDNPEHYGLLPDGDAAPEVGEPAVAGSTGGFTVREALHSKNFYLLAFATGSAGATQIPWLVFQVPHLTNAGFSLQTAALIGGIYGLFQIALRFTLGWTGDVLGRRRTLIVAYCLQGVGLLIFANLNPDRVWLLPIYYLAFGAGHASWVVLQQTMVADYFGPARFGTLRGLVATLHMPLGMLSPVITGWSFDQMGSYTPIFTIYAVMAASGAFWVLLVRGPTWAEQQPRVEPASPP
jgi:MFS family permease